MATKLPNFEQNLEVLHEGMDWPVGAVIPRSALAGGGAGHIAIGAVQLTFAQVTHPGPAAVPPSPPVAVDRDGAVKPAEAVTYSPPAGGRPWTPSPVMTGSGLREVITGAPQQPTVVLTLLGPHDPGRTAAVRALGSDVAIAEATGKAATLEAVEKYRAIRGQIEDAVRRQRDAGVRIERADAARLLLAANPEPDLAVKLRALDADRAAAEEDLARAAADRETLTAVVSPLYTAAVAAVTPVCDAAHGRRVRALSEQRQAALERLAAAVPAELLEDLAVVQSAYVSTAGNNIVAAAVVHDLIGGTPEGYQPPGSPVRGGEFVGLSEPDEFGNRYGGTNMDGTKWKGPRGVSRTM